MSFRINELEALRPHSQKPLPSHYADYPSEYEEIPYVSPRPSLLLNNRRNNEKAELVLKENRDTPLVPVPVPKYEKDRTISAYSNRSEGEHQVNPSTAAFNAATRWIHQQVVKKSRGRSRNSSITPVSVSRHQGRQPGLTSNMAQDQAMKLRQSYGQSSQPRAPPNNTARSRPMAFSDIFGPAPEISGHSQSSFSPVPVQTVKTSPSSKGEAQANADCCQICGYRPKGDPQWFKGSMAKHMKLQHWAVPPRTTRHKSYQYISLSRQKPPGAFIKIDLTISKDNTGGESERLARLLAGFGQRRRPTLRCPATPAARSSIPPGSRAHPLPSEFLGKRPHGMTSSNGLVNSSSISLKESLVQYMINDSFDSSPNGDGDNQAFDFATGTILSDLGPGGGGFL